MPLQPAENNVKDWTLADLIDLEILISEDKKLQSNPSDSLDNRDRRIFREIKAANPSLPETRRNFFRLWLEARSGERFDNISPGQEIKSGMFLISFGLFVAGTCIAFVAALLKNEENVFYFGLACIGVPFVFTNYGFWVFLGQRAAPALPALPAFLRGAIVKLARSGFRGVADRISNHLSTEKKLSAMAVMGAIEQRVGARRNAIAAKLFETIQFFGMGYAVSYLLLFGFITEGKPIQFRWGTTGRFLTDNSVHWFVSQTAFPWKVLRGEGFGFPSREQINITNLRQATDKETRDKGIAEKEAAEKEAADKAWREYLMWAALTYGLVPRLILFLLSKRQTRKALRKEDFEELRFDSLWERMTIPLGGFENSKQGDRENPGQQPVEIASPAASCVYRIVIPGELYSIERVTAIEAWLKEYKAWDEMQVLQVGASFREQNNLIGELQRHFTEYGPIKALLIQESYMPATQQTLDFLKNLRAAIGKNSAIWIGLMGKPDATPFGRPPKKSHEFEVWQKRIATLGDPNIDVLSFMNPN